MHLVPYRDQWLALVNMVMNHSVTLKDGIFTSWLTISFSRRTLLHGISLLVS
jgi:hypothetical protein